MNAHKPITGKHVLIGMVTFFGVIVAVNVTMATFASQSWTGLEVKNSYVASQSFNARLADVNRQKALGWKSRLDVTGHELRLSITRHDGTPVEISAIEAMLVRPVQESDDRPIQLSPVGAGQFTAEIDAGLKGKWDVDVTATGVGGDSYRQLFRIRLGG